MLEIGPDSVRISECWRLDRTYIRRDIRVLDIRPDKYFGITEYWKLDRTVLEYLNAGEWTGHIYVGISECWRLDQTNISG